MRRWALLLVVLSLGSACYAEMTERRKIAVTNAFRCLRPALESGRYTSFDGGKSVLRIVDVECPREIAEWNLNCINEGGDPGDCRVTVGMTIQAWLKVLGK